MANAYRNEILQIGQVVYLSQDKTPDRFIRIPTARLISVHHLDRYKDSWSVQDVSTGDFMTWHPNKIAPIEPITDIE